MRKKIRSFEKGLVFVDKEFKKIVGQGTYWNFPRFTKRSIEVVSQRDPWLRHPDLDLIVKSGALGDSAQVIDLKENERALVWIDGRFDGILDQGLYVVWTRFRKVRIETVTVTGGLFEHQELAPVLGCPQAPNVFDIFTVSEGSVAICYEDGRFQKVLAPGRYAAWKQVGNFTCTYIDIRERVIDISGQEIMTADKVSLRLNSMVTFRVSDPQLCAEKVKDLDQALYRDAQLALRSTVGTRDLDALLSDKTAVADELLSAMRRRAQAFGVEIISLGIKDVILPGDMKMLLNKVIEAKKASEANVIARREETAAMRSQMNTARLMEGNPALMRMRELEVLERIASSSKMNIVLGEKGLTDRVTNLL